MPDSRDTYGVELSCTTCALTRTYGSRDEIPERFRDGCQCGGALAVKSIGDQL